MTPIVARPSLWRLLLLRTELAIARVLVRLAPRSPIARAYIEAKIDEGRRYIRSATTRK
jgi:hypothetical protein